jgi:ribonucleoside-diphosphate reductase alpha chain
MQFVSAGFTRGQLKDKLVLVQNLATGTDDYPRHSLSSAAASEGTVTAYDAGAIDVPDVASAVAALSESTSADAGRRAMAERTEADLIMEARVKGYEGEACGECGNFTLVRNGTCLKCDTCGGTSGCS